MTKVTIKNKQSYIQGKERHPVITDSSIDYTDYKTMRNFVLKVNADDEDNMHR